MILRYTHVKQSSYTEQGGALPLDVDSIAMDSLRAKVGGEMEYYFTPQASLAAHAFYRFEMLDTYSETSASFAGTPVSFDLEGEDMGRSSGNVGLALNFDATETVSFGLGYDFTLGDDYQGHNFEATLGIKFGSCPVKTIMLRVIYARTLAIK